MTQRLHKESAEPQGGQMKLTKAQRTALEKLRDEGERGAYPGISLGTLNSLSLKRLVSAKYQAGSMAMPHTAIRWSITDEGRDALVGQTGSRS